MSVPDRVCDFCGRVILEEGRAYAIEAALDRDGVPLAQEFLSRLEGGSPRERVLHSDMLMRLEDFATSGTLARPRELNHLRGDLWEIKAQSVRLPFYYRQNLPCGQIRVTHGFLKRGEKTPRKEIDLGLAIIREDSKK